MQGGQIALLLVFATNLVLGFLVYWTNSKRSSNKIFFGLSMAIGLWLLCLNAGFRSSDPRTIEFWVRQSNAIGAFFPLLFHFLRVSITKRDLSVAEVLRSSRVWITASVVVMLLTYTPFFLSHVDVTAETVGTYGPGRPVYGPGFIIYNAFYLVAFGLLLFRYIQGMRTSSGFQRTELQFVLLATAVCLFVGVSLAMVIPLVRGNSSSVPFVPIAIVFLDGIIAYGIATRRIMEVAQILRRATSYSLLTAYLVILYFGVWFMGDAACSKVFSGDLPIPHLLAALALAFSVAPAHGRMQRVANRLFVTDRSMDVGGTVGEVNELLQSIRTIPNLLQRFSETIGSSVGSDGVYVFLRNHNGFVQKYPEVPEDQKARIIADDAPLAEELVVSREPVVGDELSRLRPTPKLKAISTQLTELEAAVAVGIRSPERLEGVLLLGPKMSGRIFGSVELNVLPILCDQLAVALENAELYTQTRDGKIYNEVLLDSLPSGVIAANMDGRITVINREAQRMANLLPDEVINKPLSILPHPLADVLESTFSTGKGLRDQDFILRNDLEQDIPIRVGTSVFTSHTGNLLGALVVFMDLTTIKKLEAQVRRTDRLASVGTLAAGMAHEIKNPLVTVKTFTQLLPERYDDEDFRGTFSTLIGQEVRRIDSIVNQLLNFARPAKPDLIPINLHEVLGNSVKLVEQQLKQAGITFEQHFRAANDAMLADSDMLKQAFLNFFLNAIDSMEPGGHLEVGTAPLKYDRRQHVELNETEGAQRIHVYIKDSGKGIGPDNLPHIFDPFFTTKGHGTGLGLSVSHGIVQDHGGDVDVESTLGEGTTFHIVFPVRIQERVT